jgi:proteasome lid subunit RPN8/RPN11
VRFGARSVCQLALLKQISAAQPGYGERGLAEVAAFVLGRRLAGGADVDVTRIVVPPFRFTADTVTFQPADLGALQAGEQFIGTYHTHPDGDLLQGVLSETDLEYMRSGFVDFAGAVGALGGQSSQLDWLFDIVDPKLGDWNVYAHDAQRLGELHERCQKQSPCPINELRLAGSAFNLYSRVYEERDDEWP